MFGPRVKNIGSKNHFRVCNYLPLKMLILLFFVYILKTINYKDIRFFAKWSIMNDLEFEVKVKGQGHIQNHENKAFYRV